MRYKVGYRISRGGDDELQVWLCEDVDADTVLERFWEENPFVVEVARFDFEVTVRVVYVVPA